MHFVGEVDKIAAMPHEPPPLPPPLPAGDFADRPDKRGFLSLFFLGNLLAIYIPGILPALIRLRATGTEQVAQDSLRLFVIDVFESPLAVPARLIDGLMFKLAPAIGDLASFYAFVFLVWGIVLALSLVFAQLHRRYMLTLALALLSAGQAVFVTTQLLREQRDEPKPQQIEPREPGAWRPD